MHLSTILTSLAIVAPAISAPIIPISIAEANAVAMAGAAAITTRDTPSASVRLQYSIPTPEPANKQGPTQRHPSNPPALHRPLQPMPVGDSLVSPNPSYLDGRDTDTDSDVSEYTLHDGNCWLYDQSGCGGTERALEVGTHSFVPFHSVSIWCTAVQ
ncbi:hypothetical protein ASPWEDRAFT_29560 [Aspergillus wentii DTO 134E9]|uniref:Uncharacterized protein n=1 Tax=Aspergillus wentii DTO 134E9 TaxID=1073089 RepID=A0A1L9RHQ9_ASPWE|nr:uncharacterized protein ASPWEDRAFT_29560 [Aspergillus wentii DTO 134E9]OJJ34408.1 hypothetical protein ASPWEDRAFT_29560 [Aspergillus wentii DTO 134E9]